MERIYVKTEGKTSEIFIEFGLFKNIPEIFNDRYKGRKLALISDTNVYSIYGNALLESLAQPGFQVVPIVYEAGEENKNLSTLSYIYSSLAENDFTRSDVIIALGGGVTGDMAGLAAATFLRGMGLVHIPTSLLAMVDSSIGGKVAVDLPQGKNLVGAFYQPDIVLTDPALLNTLPKRQLSSGMAELIKHGFIRSSELAKSITGLKWGSSGDLSFLNGLIAESCRIKRDIVQEDEKDNGVRQLLNFGHTIGHAIERLGDYKVFTHGEAISIGMVLITRITEEMGLTKKGESGRIARALGALELPSELPQVDCEKLIDAMRKDKKNRSGKITISYVKEIGRGSLHEMNITELEEKIHAICKDSSINN